MTKTAKHCGVTALLILSSLVTLSAQEEHAVTKLDRVLKAEGLAIVGVSEVRDAQGNVTTWKVYPESLQAVAQPFIDTFNPATVLSPAPIPTREFFRRFTREEVRVLRAAALQSDDIAYMREDMLAGPTVDVTSPLVTTSLEALKAVLIPSVWADEAAADIRIAELKAPPLAAPPNGVVGDDSGPSLNEAPSSGGP